MIEPDNNSRKSGSPAEEDTDFGSDVAESKTYFRRLVNEKPDRHIELALSLVIAFFAAVQLITSCNNSTTSSQQTNQLITAAEISAVAANRNAEAAGNFAQSARSINEGISESVKELRQQAEIADSARENSETASNRSLTEVSDNFRREQRAWIGLSPFVDFKAANNQKNLVDKAGTPIGITEQSLVSIVNTGRTPARNVKVIFVTWVEPISAEPSQQDAGWMGRVIAAKRSGEFGKYFEVFLESETRRKGSDDYFMYDSSLVPPGRRGFDIFHSVNELSGGSMFPGIPLQLSGPNITMSSDIKIPRVIFGEVRYFDVFGDVEHKTTFCSYLNATTSWAYSSCSVFNAVE